MTNRSKRDLIMKSATCVLFMILPFSCTINAQNTWASFGIEAGNLSRNSDSWFDTNGFRAGITHRFGKSTALNIDIGTLRYFEGDNEEKSANEAAWEALSRASINYRIVRVIPQLTVVNVGKGSLIAQLGISGRFSNEVFHSYVEVIVKNTITNTDEVLTRTVYREKFDLGIVFGLSYSLQMRDNLELSAFLNLENYGDSEGEINEEPTYSIISNGLKVMIQL